MKACKGNNHLWMLNLLSTYCYPIVIWPTLHLWEFLWCWLDLWLLAWILFFIADFYLSSQACQCWPPQLVFILFHFVRQQYYWLSWCPSLVFQLAFSIQVSEPCRVISGSRDFLLEKVEQMTSNCHLQCKMTPTYWIAHGVTQSELPSGNYYSCQVGCLFLAIHGVNLRNFVQWEIIDLQYPNRKGSPMWVIMVQVSGLSFWDRTLSV